MGIPPLKTVSVITGVVITATFVFHIMTGSLLKIPRQITTNLVCGTRRQVLTVPNTSESRPDTGELVKKLRKDILSHRSLESHFIPRENKVNPHNYSFIIPAEGLCKGEPPYILACVPSVYNHETERQVIRKTWGSVVRTGVWADGSPLPPIKLMFIIGNQEDKDVEPILHNESLTYDDIVLANFIDSYANLTIKSMSILQWMITFCPDAQYVLKNDEDTLVNLTGMVKFLQDRKPEGIVGKQGYQLTVVRDGIKKWNVPKEEYPPDLYPPYILGSFYLIPNSIVAILYETSQHIPFLSMEDVFMTGVVRLTAGVSLVNLGGRACIYQCDINNINLLSYTFGISNISQVWSKLTNVTNGLM